MKKLMEQITKFGAVGGFCFLLDYGVYTALIMFFGVHHLAANAVSFTVSLIVNYVLSMKFVFARREELDRRAEFVIFTVLSIGGLILSELIIWVCVDILYKKTGLAGSGFTLKTAKQAAKIISSGIVMVYNFVTRKIFLEKKS